MVQQQSSGDDPVLRDMVRQIIKDTSKRKLGKRLQKLWALLPQLFQQLGNPGAEATKTFEQQLLAFFEEQDTAEFGLMPLPDIHAQILQFWHTGGYNPPLRAYDGGTDYIAAVDLSEVHNAMLEIMLGTVAAEAYYHKEVRQALNIKIGFFG